MSNNKNKKDDNNLELSKMSDSNDLFSRLIGDISKESATRQIIVGAVSGWGTGYLTMKVGKMAAIALGSSIILLQIANEQGYVKIDWNKINRNVDQVTDRVEKTVTGEGPKWMDKAERFVDRKLDQADSILRNKQKKVKKWYSGLIGDESGPKINNFHIFLGAFAAGVAIGVASG